MSGYSGSVSKLVQAKLLTHELVCLPMHSYLGRNITQLTAVTESYKTLLNTYPGQSSFT